MAKKGESSSGGSSKGKMFLAVIVIFGVGYFAGMNHQTTAKFYVESEPQRKEIAIKTLEISKVALDKTVEVSKNTFQFLGEKFSSMGKTVAKNDPHVLDKVDALKK